MIRFVILILIAFRIFNRLTKGNFIICVLYIFHESWYLLPSVWYPDLCSFKRLKTSTDRRNTAAVPRVFTYRTSKLYSSIQHHLLKGEKWAVKPEMPDRLIFFQRFLSVSNDSLRIKSAIVLGDKFKIKFIHFRMEVAWVNAQLKSKKRKTAFALYIIYTIT